MDRSYLLPVRWFLRTSSDPLKIQRQQAHQCSSFVVIILIAIIILTIPSVLLLVLITSIITASVALSLKRCDVPVKP